MDRSEFPENLRKLLEKVESEQGKEIKRDVFLALSYSRRPNRNNRDLIDLHETVSVCRPIKTKVLAEASLVVNLTKGTLYKHRSELKVEPKEVVRKLVEDNYQSIYQFLTEKGI